MRSTRVVLQPVYHMLRKMHKGLDAHTRSAFDVKLTAVGEVERSLDLNEVRHSVGPLVTGRVMFEEISRPK